MSTALITLIVVAAIVLLLLIWVVTTYNSFISVRNKLDEAFSTMDVYLKKRFDLIPNLVETVKGYAKHESSTLEKVTEARSMIQNADGVEDKLAAENMLSGTLRSLFAVSENYPDLKANVNFMSLQSELTNIEEEIANSRKYYNAITRKFNTKVESFPSNIIAGIFNFKRKPMFEVSDESQRENVKVEF
jgi:LemA protein